MKPDLEEYAKLMKSGVSSLLAGAALGDKAKSDGVVATVRQMLDILGINSVEALAGAIFGLALVGNTFREYTPQLTQAQTDTMVLVEANIVAALYDNYISLQSADDDISHLDF